MKYKKNDILTDSDGVTYKVIRASHVTYLLSACDEIDIDIPGKGTLVYVWNNKFDINRTRISSGILNESSSLLCYANNLLSGATYVWKNWRVCEETR